MDFVYIRPQRENFVGQQVLEKYGYGKNVWDCVRDHGWAVFNSRFHTLSKMLDRTKLVNERACTCPW